MRKLSNIETSIESQDSIEFSHSDFIESPVEYLDFDECQDLTQSQNSNENFQFHSLSKFN